MIENKTEILAKRCPHCGSEKLLKVGKWRTVANPEFKQRYRCKSCWRSFY